MTATTLHPAPTSDRAHAVTTNDGLLRFSTAGSVDDGKSTLIGRLLYDSKALFDDQIAAVERASAKRGYDGLDLALLTDGLTAEREQGITIDVAYRYFSTPRRKFIIADTPGHEQYTRNMVTGASTADAAIVLVDARQGLLRQSRRHACIASLLRIPHVLLAVNKMDLVDWSEARFRELEREFLELAERIGIEDAHAIPMSALQGDMVVERGTHLDWFQGRPLLEVLETIPLASDDREAALRFPVQLVSRVQLPAGAPGAAAVVGDDGDRAYLGRIEAGSVAVGDRVTVLPSGRESTVREIRLWPSRLERAHVGQSVSIALADEIDISRGDMLIHSHGLAPRVVRELEAVVCWMDGTPLDPSRKYIVKHTTSAVRAILSRPHYRLDVDTLAHEAADTLALNDIGRLGIRLAGPLAIDDYADNRTTGSFIVIDEFTRSTVAAGFVVAPGSSETVR